MHSFLGFLGTVTLLLGMVNHVHANTGREDAEGLRAGVVLEVGEIDSSTVEVGALAMVVYGQGERHPTSEAWAKLDTARGYIKAVDQRRLIVGLEPDGWSKWIALERIQKLILVGSPSWRRSADQVSTQGDKKIQAAANRVDNDREIDSSRKEYIQAQADSNYTAGAFQATPDTISVKTEDRSGGARRVAGKLLRGVVGGYAFLWAGTLIGADIDDYYGKCRGLLPSNDQHNSEDEKLCIDVGAFIGASTGWVLGAPVGVSMLEPNDRFIHTLGGSLGGLVTCGLLTMVSGGTLWPSIIVAPVVFATVASEWSRNAELSRNPLEARGEGRRFFIGLVSNPKGYLAAIVTLRF